MDYLIPVEKDEQYGLNVFVGDELVILHEGKPVHCQCMGWRLNTQTDVYYVKTDQFDPVQYWTRWDVPMDQVQISITPREARLRSMYTVTA